MAPVSTISDKVSDQLLSICRRNSAHAALPLVLAMLLTCVLLYSKVDEQLLQVWALASCTAILSRVYLLRVVSRTRKLDGARKRLCATILTLILGCTVSSVLYFFPYVGMFERAMLTAILLGLCTVSYSTNFGYQPLLIAYIGPMLGTLSLMWILNINQQIPTPLAVSVGVSVLIVAHTLVRNGKFMFEVLQLAIESSTKLEEQSQRLTEALGNAERATQEAETSSQSKTRFIAAASHDLRQPVHVLNLFGGALKHAKLDDKTREIADNMDIAVTSLSSQLNSLLDMSELDSGSVQPEFKSVDLYQLSSSLMGELKKLAEDKQIAMINRVPQSVFVQTDPSMLSQIIRNLCGNAIKYTEEGSVTLDAHCSSTSVVLHIADTGIGIDSAESGKVFEEFYQASNPSRDKSQGLGLGLSIVERLIRTLGHSISLESSLGVGTTISIDMPICTINQGSAAYTPVAEVREAMPLPKDFWLHIVDDDTAVLQSIRAFLIPLGCKVTSSENAQEAIRFLATHTPSALIVDFRLNGEESGLAIIDALKDMESHIPAALITGESMSDGELTDAYPDLVMLQKPVSNDAVLGLLDYMVVSAQENDGSQALEIEGSHERVHSPDYS